MTSRDHKQTATPAATLERHEPVAVITLNRLEAMDAVNAALSAAVGEALEELAAYPELKVWVIIGADRAFCAGADLKELAAGQSLFAPSHPEWGFAGLVQHYMDKPLIAAVNGFALGGGTEIGAGLRSRGDERAGQPREPEVKRGLFAAAIGLLRLGRQIPLEAALTGEPLDPATALRWGLVNRVVPPEDVLPVALELAGKIAENARSPCRPASA